MKERFNERAARIANRFEKGREGGTLPATNWQGLAVNWGPPPAGPVTYDFPRRVR